MSYEPTNWKDGDLVTSAKLNKMEQGIAAGGSGGMFFVESELDESTDTETLNKTFGEIREAVFTNHMGVAITNNNSEAAYFVMSIKCGKVDGGSVVVGAPGPGGVNVILYTADTDAEYPSFSYEAMTH